MMKSDANPKDPTQRLRNAPRCTATAKRTGQSCQASAARGWRVCRVHGAGGGAPPGPAHPNYRHGSRTKEMQTVKRMISVLCRNAKETANEIN
jgi:hypothetical protein